jgi:hypothetical protein
MSTDPLKFLRDVIIPVIKQQMSKGATEEQKWIGFGNIDPSYVSGLPAVIWDGEFSVSIKKYPYISPYVPVAGDRVELLRSGATWVIQGKVINA